MRKLNQRRDRDAVHVAARIKYAKFCSSFYFFNKDVFVLILNGSELIKRLINCGFSEFTAWDICTKFAADGDYSGLKEFIRQQELLYNDRKQYV